MNEKQRTCERYNELYEIHHRRMGFLVRLLCACTAMTIIPVMLIVIISAPQPDDIAKEMIRTAFGHMHILLAVAVVLTLFAELLVVYSMDRKEMDKGYLKEYKEVKKKMKKNGWL